MPVPAVKPAAPPVGTRERILDAAAVVLTERGIARTTTRAIAEAARCSEALLYKYFADKQEIFLAVLTERLKGGGGLELPIPGEGDLVDNLAQLIERYLVLFVQTFPMAVSIFGQPALLAEHRDGVRSRGAGPEGPVRAARAYLAGEQAIGRVAPETDLDVAAAALVGTAFHRAFLAAFDGRDEVPDAAAFSRATATTLLAGLAA